MPAERVARGGVEGRPVMIWPSEIVDKAILLCERRRRFSRVGEAAIGRGRQKFEIRSGVVETAVPER